MNLVRETSATSVRRPEKQDWRRTPPARALAEREGAGRPVALVRSVLAVAAPDHGTADGAVLDEAFAVLTRRRGRGGTGPVSDPPGGILCRHD
ncbi:hypothetical protein [Streptomyces yaizuensis]|uniref:Uncharacterized protein n=1 Tax=Streptomyces yaizuensis TaxID=2989713 RepID=A0ABQ5P2L4_9ACTN|nr:hypothetical protein [Streptomyces sp. YSPA8]GLF96852.1 hypothetical protein SYYSPA8_21165 [Streptomyces sp. YSPA8]